MEDILKDLSALFCSLVPKGSSLGVLLITSLKRLKFAFFKFRVLSLFFVWPLPYLSGLQTPPLHNHHSPGCLQSWCPQSVCSCCCLVGPVSHHPVVGLSITWLQKLSRRLLDCLKFALLLSQWMSEQLKSPGRTRVLSLMLPITWTRRLHPQNALDQTGCSRCYPQVSFHCLRLWCLPSGFQPIHGCSSEVALHIKSTSWHWEQTSSHPSSPVPSDQPVAIDSCTQEPHMAFIPPGCSDLK